LKNVDPCGVRIGDGLLLVPMRDIDGKLWSLQEIFPSGDKLFMKGGRTAGRP
jgi:putative DNA primase/helicase